MLGLDTFRMHLSQHKLCTTKMELSLGCTPCRRTLTNGSDAKYILPRCRLVLVFVLCWCSQLFTLHSVSHAWAALCWSRQQSFTEFHSLLRNQSQTLPASDILGIFFYIQTLYTNKYILYSVLIFSSTLLPWTTTHSESLPSSYSVLTQIKFMLCYQRQLSGLYFSGVVVMSLPGAMLERVAWVGSTNHGLNLIHNQLFLLRERGARLRHFSNAFCDHRSFRLWFSNSVFFFSCTGKLGRLFHQLGSQARPAEN